MSARAPAIDATRRWEQAPARVALREDDVHVWRADLDRPARPLAQLAQALSPDERLRAESLVYPRDRWRFIAARGMLRWLLACYLDCELGALVMRDGPNGKPELVGPSGGPPLRFNYSRSQRDALYAVTRGRRVGVDLEAIRPVPEAEQIARRWFSYREQAALAAVPIGQRERAFLRTWTWKEAYVKAVGVGISGGLERIEVTFPADSPPTLRLLDGDPIGATRWSLQEPPAIPGHVAALVTEARDCSLRCWSLRPGLGLSC